MAKSDNKNDKDNPLLKVRHLEPQKIVKGPSFGRKKKNKKGDE